MKLSLVKAVALHRSVLLAVLSLWLIFVAAGCTTGKSAQLGSASGAPEDIIALLAPDSGTNADPKITVWLDAAAEEGLHAIVIHDSEFLAKKRRYAGVIFPDGIHTQAGNELIDGLRDYVKAGGNLMIVYDAGSLMPNGRYAIPQSRLSQLVGVNYALYDSLRDATIRRAAPWGSPEVMDALEIPPGKSAPAETELIVAGQKELAFKARETTYYTLDAYSYGHLEYPSFVTQGPYDGQELFQSSAGLVAGYRPLEKGSVLFVNLPLGYLALRTDGLLLHGFLHYFSQHIGLPYLAAVPDGIGGLVLNWHLDSNAVEPVMPLLEKIGFFEQGPYSFHLTAGPDRDKPGDGLGMDLRHNRVMQRWVHVFEQQGSTIGDHGGWMHNYFGLNVNEHNQGEFEKYLTLNNEALQGVTGHPIREYSAPVGTHPKWVTSWLEAHGFSAYYFTGNTGMGPTKTYRDGARSDHAIWSFPICNLGKAASLEDMHFANVPESDVAAWLRGMSEFVSRERVSRLVYAHPPGATFYPDALRSWLQKTRELKQNGTFRWYTMSELADFLSSRQTVQWQMTRSRSETIVRATHPSSLVHQTWFLPKNAYGRPRIIEGNAKVEEDLQRWIVIAGDGTALAFAAPKAGSR